MNLQKHTVILPLTLEPLAWSLDNRYVIGTDETMAAVLYSLDGHRIAYLADKNSHSRVYAWSPDSQKFALGRANGDLSIHDLTGAVLMTLTGRQHTLTACAWSPSGNKVLSASDDSTIQLWHADGKLCSEIRGHRVKQCAWSPDSQWLALISADQNLLLYRHDGKLLSILADNSTPINFVAWSAASSILSGVCQDGRVRLWHINFEGGVVGSQYLSYPGVSFDDCRWSPTHERIVCAGGNLLYIIGTDIAKHLQGNGNYITDFQWSPDGSLLAVTYDDGSLKLWRGDDTLLTEEQCEGMLSACVWSSDSRYLATLNSDNNTLDLWQSSGQWLATLANHDADIEHLTWSCDSNTVLSFSADKVLKQSQLLLIRAELTADVVA